MGELDSSPTVELLGVPFRPVSTESLVAEIEGWVAARRGAYVCAVCAHSLVEASGNPEFMRALLRADINLPDGMPVAWALTRLMGRRQERLAGPAAMLTLLELAHLRHLRVLLYGSTPGVQRSVAELISQDYPGTVLADCISPPYRPLSESEDAAMCNRIRKAKPDVILVSLGAPKQEVWMSRHRDVLGAPAVGVGAAFEYNIGMISRAPRWMQRAGLEWSYRLVQQPRRVGLKMASTFPVFAWRTLGQLARDELRKHGVTKVRDVK